MNTRLLIICNDLDFFLLHRLPEALGAIQEGYEVHVATPASKRSHEALQLGFVHHEIQLFRGSLNPFIEFFSMASIFNLLKKNKPDILYLVTLKPTIYGGIIARMLKIKAVVYGIFGLGFLFTDKKNLLIFFVS